MQPDDYPAVPEWLTALQIGPRNDPVELRIKRPDGGERMACVGSGEATDGTGMNSQLRQVMVRQLPEFGCRVLKAKRAEAALESDRIGGLLAAHVVMPGMMDALGLAYEATQLRRGLKTPLTLCSPSVGGAGQHALDCPFPLLNKPSRHDELGRRRPNQTGAFHGSERASFMKPV